jgi:tetratricopeptide (TPR) repeat protein
MSNPARTSPFGDAAVARRRPRPRPRPSFLALVPFLTLLVATPAQAQTAETWVGARVMCRTSRATLKVGPKVSATITAGSVFRVDRVSGEWLWVDSGNIQGWVKKADVVACDQAIAYFTEVIRDVPGDAYAYLSRGIAHHSARNHDGAIADYTEAIRLDPKAPWPYHDRAVSYHAKNEFDRALTDASEAVKLDLAEGAHLGNRADIQFALRDFDRAIADYTEALRLSKGQEATLSDGADEGAPGQTRGRLSSAKWLCARAECWAAKHAPDKAIADYAEAVRRDPRDAASVNSLAWLLATCEESRFRDADRAFTLAARACELTGYRNHFCLDTLAAACAEAGDFLAAIKWEGQALDLSARDPRVTEAYRARLKLFREKTAYHEG